MSLVPTLSSPAAAIRQQRRSTRRRITTTSSTTLADDNEEDDEIMQEMIPPSSPPQQHYPRRYPRIGTAFQCKLLVIPSSSQNSSNSKQQQQQQPRPLPQRMSTLYPHCTTCEEELATITISKTDTTASQPPQPLETTAALAAPNPKEIAAAAATTSRRSDRTLGYETQPSRNRNTTIATPAQPPPHQQRSGGQLLHPQCNAQTRQCFLPYIHLPASASSATATTNNNNPFPQPSSIKVAENGTASSSYLVVSPSLALWAEQVQSWHQQQQQQQHQEQKCIVPTTTTTASGRKSTSRYSTNNLNTTIGNTRKRSFSNVEQQQQQESATKIPLPMHRMGPFAGANCNDDDCDPSAAIVMTTARRRPNKKQPSSTSSSAHNVVVDPLSSTTTTTFENDEVVLTNHWMEHGGCSHQALLSTWVQWAHGRSYRTWRRQRRKCQQQQQRSLTAVTSSSLSQQANNDDNKPTKRRRMNHSDSNESPLLPIDFMRYTQTVISGDYRDNDGNDLNKLPQEDQTTNDVVQQRQSSSLSQDDVTTTWNEEQITATWNAVLSCAHACLEQIKSKQHTVYVSAVAHFLTQVSQLPPPPPVPTTTLSSLLLPASSSSGQLATLDELLDLYHTARRRQAQIWDLWGRQPDGVDLDLVRKHLVDCSSESSGLVLDEVEHIQRQIDRITAWQGRVEQVLGQQQQGNTNSTTLDEVGGGGGATTTAMPPPAEQRSDLCALETLLAEGRQHGVRCKTLVMLEQKIDKAYQLQDRIVKWQKSHSNNETTRESIKFIAAMVREIHRLKIRSTIINQLLTFHQTAESWIERANVAIRSRISLDEVKALVERGLEMPLDLKEYLEKLQSRVSMATEWLNNFEHLVPSSDRQQLRNLEEQDDDPQLALLRQIRTVLDQSNWHFSSLFDLANAGLRIPVEIDYVKLLHIELDARAWTSKANKWMPSSDESNDASRRGKLEDLREHLAKGSALRDRLVLSSTAAKDAWVLDGESQLSAIVQAADDWIAAYQSMVDDGDEDKTYGIDDLRKIVQEGQSVYANMGTGFTKFNKILVQANKWYEKYQSLFVRCHLRGDDSILPDGSTTTAAPVQLHELQSAIEAGVADISLELVEVEELKVLVKQIESWLHRARLASGQERQTKGRKLLFSFDDLIALIDESKSLPISPEIEVEGLQEQCRRIREWQQRADDELEVIRQGFRALRETVNETYGLPCNYRRRLVSDNPSDTEISDTTNNKSLINGGSSTVDANTVSLPDDSMDVTTDDSSSHGDATASTLTSEQEMNVGSGGDLNVHSLIKSFCNECNIASCILTSETEIAAELKDIARWCVQSLKYVENERDPFSKRTFTAFDKLLAEGKALVQSSNERPQSLRKEGTDPSCVKSLRSEWTLFISDQLERLNFLLAERSRFLALCKKAENVVDAVDRRPTIESLNELAESSREFPASSDVIKKLQKFALKANTWIQLAKQALSSESRMSLQDARDLLAQGDEIGFTCTEMKSLRHGIKVARGWSNRAKRCKSDAGDSQRDIVQALIEEEKSLLIDMSEEATQLQGAVTNYCLCRRPYDGFMIACDECEDWFHGPCVGVTESRADRVNKYVCLRCSLVKTYKASSSTCVDVIRKWVSKKDLKKSRQIENQKHKRKVRKETKDIEKFQVECEALQQHLERLARAEIVIPKTDDTLCEHESSSATVKSQLPESVASIATCANVLPDQVSNVEEGTDEISKSQSTAVVVTESSKTSAAVQALATTEESTTAETVVSHQARVNDVETSNDSPEDQQIGENVVHESLSKEDTLTALAKLEAMIQGCRSRLTDLAACDIKQKALEDREDKMSTILRSWVLGVRMHVLVPSTIEVAKSSMPKQDGSLSDAMIAMGDNAKRLGINELPDVGLVMNCFKCMSWCLRAIASFARQPTSTDLLQLVDQTISIEFPDEKAIRVIKGLSQRAAAWESKVEKALAPVPGEKRPFNLDTLKLLATTGGDIPVFIPLEPRLATVIEDGGCRHCLCGGPSDGRFMIGCDNCDDWFHGHCVMISPNDDHADWKCPKCTGVVEEITTLQLDEFHRNYDANVASDPNDDGSDSDKTVSCMKTLQPDQLWPPFGLFGSESAREALGDDVCAIPNYPDLLSTVELPASEPPSIGFGSKELSNALDTAKLPVMSGVLPTSCEGMGFGSLASSKGTAILGYGSQSHLTNGVNNGTTVGPSYVLASSKGESFTSISASVVAPSTTTLPVTIAKDTSMMYGVNVTTVLPRDVDVPAPATAQTVDPF